jgi:hypothetical protein
MRTLLKICLVLTASLGFCLNSNAHQTELDSFQMVVRLYKNDGLCFIRTNGGNDWYIIMLEHLKPGSVHHITTKGSVLASVDTADKAEQSGYKFSAERKGNKIYLNSIRGTAWTKLNFTLNKKRKGVTINHLGMLP